MHPVCDSSQLSGLELTDRRGGQVLRRKDPATSPLVRMVIIFPVLRKGPMTI